MTMERTASLSMIDTSRTTVVPKRVRPPVKNHFAPISDCETAIFDALQQKESGVAKDPSERRKPRFSLIRGEVALLAERVLHLGRQST